MSHVVTVRSCWMVKRCWTPSAWTASTCTAMCQHCRSAGRSSRSCTVTAGALAFRLFLFMVPFVYVVFTVLGVASRAVGHDPAQLARNAGITGVLASAVVKAGDQGAWTQVTLVLGAVVAMLLTAAT
jgi:uncharacterized BrkB/YihY/UPF0761 family membrane protein